LLLPVLRARRVSSRVYAADDRQVSETSSTSDLLFLPSLG
jgi:hypothetical protein